MNNTFKVNYLARDFSSIKEELKKYAKRYYSDNFADLSEASINSFMIDSVAYVGDVLSYYLDYQANESFLQTAIEDQNIDKLAKSLGYRRQNTSTTTGKVALYILIPSDNNGSPDYNKVPIIKKGTSIRSLSATKFLINEDIIIDENIVGTNYVVARTNDVGNPTYYAVKIYVPIISGEITSTTIAVNNFIKFNKIALSDANIAEIISVFDSENNEYYEVPSLSQNVIYRSVLNKDSINSLTKYSIKPISAIRRFVFDFDTVTAFLLFGAKQYKPDEDLSIDPVAEPTKFVLEKYNNDFLQDATFEPNTLLNGDQFGIGPENTTLTVTYRRNTSTNNNANTGEVNSVDELLYEFPIETPDNATIETIINSVQVINEEPIIGQTTDISLTDVKDISAKLFQSQGRAVTAKDYEALCYTMPSKYGSIKRAKASRDANSLKNNINLYVISNNRDNQLVSCNSQIKENLKTWLSSYKLLTDTVDIIDAKVINLGISFTILVDPAYNKLDIRNLALNQLRFVFSSKPQIGETFNILDVYRELRKINEILDVIDVKVRNITGVGYSSVAFNVQQNLTSDNNQIIIPKNAIYEIKFPNVDIIGNVV